MMTSPYIDPQRAVPVWREQPRRISQEISAEREEWVIQARCRQDDPDALFVQGAKQRQAAAVCRHCLVRDQCLATSLDNREEFGVWGGLTERQRRSLLRENSHIDDWAGYLAAGGNLIDPHPSR